MPEPTETPFNNASTFRNMFTWTNGLLSALNPYVSVYWPELSESTTDPSEVLRKFRKTERAQMIEAVRDLIEGPWKRAKSNYTPSKERARWTRLAGQLIWYKDQILRSMSYEALEEEVAQLKEMVLKKKAENLVSPRRTIRDASGSIVLHRPGRPGPSLRRASKS